MNTVFEKNKISFNKEEVEKRTYFEKKHRISKKKIEVGVQKIEGRKVLYAVKEQAQYQLDSLYQSEELLERWFCQFDNINYRSRYLLFGMGNGMYVRKLLQCAGEETVIVVVEPSLEIFINVMKEFDISDILSNERVKIIVEGIDTVRFIEVLRIVLQYEDLPGAICRSYLNYPALFPDQYQEYNETIMNHSNSIEANHTVMLRMGKAYFEGSMANFPYYMAGKSLIALSRMLVKDIPAILVSAGPSLDKNMHLLKTAKGKSFILAVDSAAEALVKNGIIPDMFITIDAIKNMQHFANETVQRIPLITNMFTSRYSLSLHTGDKYFLHDKNTYVEELFHKFGKILAEVDGGGSVATDAFALLERMQFKTIILVGQDLAYTDKKTHSEFSLRGGWKEDISERLIVEMEDVYGGIVQSSYEFQIYLGWFVEEIRNNTKIRVIDATEGGAKIEGTIIQTLEETISKECKKEVDIQKILDNIPDRLTEQEKEMFLEHIYNIPERLEKELLLIQKTLRYYQKMKAELQKDKIDVRNIQKLEKKAKRNNQLLEADPIYFYVMCYTAEQIAEEFPNGVLDVKKEEEDEINIIMEDSIRYFEILEKQTIFHIKEAKDWIAPKDLKKLLVERRQLYLDSM